MGLKSKLITLKYWTTYGALEGLWNPGWTLHSYDKYIYVDIFSYPAQALPWRDKRKNLLFNKADVVY